MNTAEINPYSHDPPMMAIPRNGQEWRQPWHQQADAALLQTEPGDTINGSQEAK